MIAIENGYDWDVDKAIRKQLPKKKADSDSSNSWNYRQSFNNEGISYDYLRAVESKNQAKKLKKFLDAYKRIKAEPTKVEKPKIKKPYISIFEM